MAEKLKLTVSMFIVGTIGIFVSYIPLPSSVIALARALSGTIFLLIVMAAKRTAPDKNAIRKNAVLLLLSGSALGFNWVLLFEAYKYTTVAVATLCYYMAPVFVVILSPFLLKEKLTPAKLFFTVTAVSGAVLISGVFSGGSGSIKGILFGLSAAVLYCGIIIMNKKIVSIDGLLRTLCQLTVSAVVMAVYVLFTQKLSALTFSGRTILLLAAVGIIHTGIVYMLFFPAVAKLPAQISSLISYIDPVTAVILSAAVLNQPLTAVQLAGTVLIIGSALAVSLINEKKR